MVEFIIGALAVWRIYWMINWEAGPLGIVEKIRNVLEWLYNHRVTTPYNIMNCIYCFTVWVGLVIAYALHGAQPETVVWALAYSAGAIAIDRIHEVHILQ